VTLDEVFVRKCDTFTFHSQCKLWIIDAKCTRNFVTSIFHYFRTWIEVFVNSLTEAHQFNFFSFHFFHEASNVFYSADFVKHLKNSFVRAAVSRAPKCRDTSSDTCIWLRTSRTILTYCRLRRILFVVCMKREVTVHCFCKN